VKVDKQELKVLNRNGKAVFDAKAGEDFAALGFSPNGEFAGGAVLVGYGIRNPGKKYDSYASAEKDALRGKVAVAFRFEPQDGAGKSRWAKGAARGSPWTQSASLLNKAGWAAQRGAVALVVVNPPSQDMDKTLRRPEDTAHGIKAKIPVIHVRSDALRQILRAAGRDADAAAVRKLQRLADSGKDRVEALEGVVLRGRLTFRALSGTVHNVAGILPGAGALADEVIIVGAHYDHLGLGGQGSLAGKRAVHPGADDNASGTAAVLMLARSFRERVASGAAPASRRTLLFAAFTAEERGLLGSNHLAKHLEDCGVKPRQVAAMINIDMIGRPRNNRLYALGADSGDGWRAILAGAGRSAGIDLRPIGSVGAADHLAFYYSTKVPVLHFFTGAHRDYHTPGDTADRIDSDGAARAVAAADAVLTCLWARPERLAYRPPKPGAHMFAAGKGAYLGLFPDVRGSDGEGCVVMAVIAGGPAEKAGLKDGDVIVGWNGKPIDGLMAILEATAASSPGAKVKLSVRRNGAPRTVQVTLGRRG